MFKKWRIFFHNNFLIILILSLGFFLRSYHYPNFPVSGETADEVAWAMLGASLIQTRQPASWSHFEAYQDYVAEQLVVKYESQDVIYNLVSPVLDHPPLFSLIPGFFHSLKAPWNKLPSIKLIRFPMIFLGSLNIYLLYLVARQIFDDNPTRVYLATLAYAILPSFVFSSRLVIAENLLVTWTLLAIYLLISRVKKKNLYLILISIAAILTKVSGLIIPLGIIAYSWQKSDKKIAKSGLLGLLIGEGLYLLYGAVLNWPLFVEVNLSQAGRKLGLATLLNRLALHPAIVEKFFIDGWLILGLIGVIGWLLLNPKKYLPIKIYLILWLAFIAATVGETTFHGWYDYPLYPIFALGIGWLLDYLVKQKLYWLSWLSWLISLATLRMGLVFSNQYQHLSNITLRGLMLLGGTPLAFSLIKKEQLARYTIFILGLIMVLASIITVLKVNHPHYWETDLFFYLR